MDPDGLSIFILYAALLAALLSAWRAGAVCAEEEDKAEYSTAIGFSSRIAGYFLAYVFAFGFSVFWAFTRVSAWGLWHIALFICAVLLSVVLYALAFSKAKCENTWYDTLVRYSLGAVFTLPARLLFKALHITARANITEEALLSFVDDVEEQDLIDESQKEMITNIFELDDVTAGEIMTHRTELTSVADDTPLCEVVALALAEGFSRMPVYRKTMDEIVGIVYVKDLLALYNAPQRANAPVSEFMRAAMFVPEACHARELLIDFKLKHTQIAIVVDEYGGTAGLVTMEDVLEEIVGNIQDEFDDEEEDLLPIEGGFLAAGSLDLEDLFDAFGFALPDDENGDYDSVGGLVIDRIGRIPAAGEDISVTFGGIVFTVTEVGERRILQVRCTRETPLAHLETDKEQTAE